MRRLPPAGSGHNSSGEWGPPPESATTVLAVGVPDEARGAPVAVASARRAPWAALWPQLRHLA